MTKISALPTDSAPTSTDYIPTLDTETSTTKKAPISALQPMDNPYKFAAYMNANQTLTTGGTYYTIQYNTELFDSNSNYNNSTYIYTVPITGFYMIGCQAQLLSQAGAVFIIGLALNGTSETHRMVEIPNTTGNITVQGCRLISLTAGDTMRVLARSDTSGKILSSNSSVSSFYAYLVSRT